MKKEKINNLNINLNISYACKDGEETEVENRLLRLITEETKGKEGLLNTSILPWKKSYYFSVKSVSGKIIK
jgi:hypothetical protein